MSLHSLWVLKQVKRARNRIITLRFTVPLTLRVNGSYWERRGCAWRDIRFGHGQNTQMGRSDPTFGSLWLPKRIVGSLQPRKQGSALFAKCFARVQRRERREKEETHVDHQQAPATREARVRVGRACRSRGREVRHVYRQHSGSRRQFGDEDAVVEGQALHELEKTATAGRPERSPHHRHPKITGKGMMQRILNSKTLVAFVLAAAIGMTLYFR